MKYQLFAKMLTGLAIAVTLGTANPEPSAAQSKKFFCGTSDGSPATMVRKSGGDVAIIIWSNRNFESSGWTRQRRCEVVSARFQKYDNEGKLRYIRTGTVNGYPVLCVANHQGGACPSTQVLITLNRGSDAESQLRSLLDTRNQGVRKPVNFNDETHVLSYDRNGELYADVEKWINAVPVEEGNSQPVDRGNSQELDPVW